jgi:hypothetical protein
MFYALRDELLHSFKAVSPLCKESGQDIRYIYISNAHIINLTEWG